MKNIIFRCLSVFSMIFLLVGCSEVEGLIESVDGLIKNVDKLVQEEASKNNDIESEEPANGKKVVTGKEVTSNTDEDVQEGEDPASMFGEGEDEGSVSSEYFPEVAAYYDLYEGKIDPPNGYFLPMYDDWELVSVIKDSPEMDGKGSSAMIQILITYLRNTLRT